MNAATALQRLARFAMAFHLMLASAAALAISPDELLDPEKAFRISARALDLRNVEVEFKIASGYYMYRDRFSFATASGQTLAEVEIPRGTLKEDAFFGKTETFRDLVRIRLPISEADAERGRVDLKVTSQGCTDSGVCYTPLEQTVSARLPSRSGGSSVAWSSTSVVSILAALSSLAAIVLGWRLARPRFARVAAMASSVSRLALRAPGLQAVALAVSAVAILGVGGGLPDVFRMLAWAAWLIIAAVLLRATDPLPPGAFGVARLGKAVGVVLLVWGISVLVGATSGATDPLQPFAALRPTAASGIR